MKSANGVCSYLLYLTYRRLTIDCERTVCGDDGMQSIILWVVAERQPVCGTRRKKEKKVNYRSCAVAIGQSNDESGLQREYY